MNAGDQPSAIILRTDVLHGSVTEDLIQLLLGSYCRMHRLKVFDKVLSGIRHE